MIKEPELLAYAASLDISREAPCAFEEWEQAFKGFFNALSEKIQKQQSTIGHIKGFLNMNNSSYCYFSNVGNKQGTTSNCEDMGPSLGGHLDFNVLVYGCGEEDLEAIVKKELDSLCIELEAVCSFNKISK